MHMICVYSYNILVSIYISALDIIYENVSKGNVSNAISTINPKPVRITMDVINKIKHRQKVIKFVCKPNVIKVLGELN